MINMKKTQKYKVEDIVVYLDLNNRECVGTIKSIECVKKYNWNKGKEPEYLYLMKNYDYLRDENKIIGFYKDIEPYNK